MGRRLDYLAAADELALAREIRLFASGGPLRQQLFLLAPFLAFLTGLPPPAPSSSLPYLGFYKV